MATALITGATSSLAYSLSHQLAENDWDIILSGRNKDELELLQKDLSVRYQVSVKTIIADFDDKNFTVQSYIRKAGKVDAIFMLAGYMGNADHDDISDIERIIRVNFTIPALIMTGFTQSMEKGVIVAISSVAGDRGRKKNYPYGSAKAGLTVFASGLRNRLSDGDVHIMTVKLGFTDTPMTYGMDSPLTSSRKNVAGAIITAMNKRKNEVYVPFFWRYIMLIIKAIPEFIFKKMDL